MANTAKKTEKQPKPDSFSIVIDRAILLKSLGHVQSVVEKRGTIPVLSNVKLEAGDGTLRLTATDMDIAMVETVPAHINDAGVTTVPAHTLYEIIRKLPDGSEIQLAMEENGKISISAGKSSFSLACLPADDFPVMAEGQFDSSFTLTSSELNALIDKTRFAISTEETRYYLNGIFLHEANDDNQKTLRAVATDGHRLARIEVALPDSAKGMQGVIIPRKTIAELKKLLEAESSAIEISVSESKIRFVCGKAVLVSKLIDGTFPDYERVIPSGNDRMMVVNAKAFSSAVDRVAVISSDKSRGVKLEVVQGKLTIFASSTENGSAREEIEVDYSAEPLEIGFNSRYLLEMMTQIEGETAQFLFADANAPAIVRDSVDIQALYVVMPMRV